MINGVSPTQGLDAAAAADNEPAALAARELPVVLSFEAGSVSIPFGQLESVRAGFVFELPQTLDDSPIRVLANGTLVGVGQLVRVGDALGVQLTEVAPASPRPDRA